jgi:hypothetical protein
VPANQIPMGARVGLGVLLLVTFAIGYWLFV